MEPDYISIGKCVRDYRKKAGLTQEALAEKAGIEPSNLSHIERAATKVSLPTLLRIANALGVTLDALVYDSLTANTAVPSGIIADLLAECTPREQAILADFLKASVDAFRRFGK